MMSKTDYVAIATILRELRESRTAEEVAVLDAATIRLAQYFRERNKAFDLDRFLAAVDPALARMVGGS